MGFIVLMVPVFNARARRMPYFSIMFTTGNDKLPGIKVAPLSDTKEGFYEYIRDVTSVPQ